MNRDRSNDPPKSAAELLQELQGDPAFVARAREREQLQEQVKQAHSRGLQPIIDELGRRGIWINSLVELQRNRDEYLQALPVLLQWPPAAPTVAIKEDIVRALSLPWARPLAGPVLLEEFDKAQTDGLRWTIANALAVVADGRLFEPIVSLIRNLNYGKTREMLTLALARTGHPHAVDVLIELLDDSDLVGHAVIALGKLRAQKAREHIARLVHHPEKWVQIEANKSGASQRQSSGPSPTRPIHLRKSRCAATVCIQSHYARARGGRQTGGLYGH